MKQVRLFFVLLSYAFLAGCQQRASEEIDLGTLNGSVYSNQYFGMQMTLPSDWSIQDQQSREEMMEMGGEMFAGDDKNLQAAIDAAEVTSVNLLTAFQHPIGTPVDYNPSVMCMAERIRHVPGINTGQDYLTHAKKMMQSGQIYISFPQPISSGTLGGQSFGVMQTEMSMAGVTIRQKYFAKIDKGYALAFVVSYTTDEEEAALQQILDSVTFE